MDIRQKLLNETSPETKAFILLAIGSFSIGVSFNRWVMNEILSVSLAIVFTGAGLYYAIAAIVQTKYYWNQFSTGDAALKSLGLFFMTLFVLVSIRLIYGVMDHW